MGWESSNLIGLMTGRRQLLLPGGAWAALVFLQGCLFDSHYGPPAILFVGNSITLHGQYPAVGWYQFNGMAATALDSDYVHQTLRRLETKGIGARAEFGRRDCDDCDTIGVFEEFRGNIEAIMDEISPRWVVVQLGENLTGELGNSKSLLGYRNLVMELRKSGTFQIFCITAWGNGSMNNPQNMALQQAVAGLTRVHIVNITSVASDPANYGDSLLYANRAVQWHPGNRGMDAIAAILADSMSAYP